MNQRIRTLLAGGLLALALFGAATAGPLEDGQAAYRRHDYSTALQIWSPLADQGNADAQFKVGDIFYYFNDGVPLTSASEDSRAFANFALDRVTHWNSRTLEWPVNMG